MFFYMAGSGRLVNYFGGSLVKSFAGGRLRILRLSGPEASLRQSTGRPCRQQVCLLESSGLAFSESWVLRLPGSWTPSFSDSRVLKLSGSDCLGSHGLGVSSSSFSRGHIGIGLRPGNGSLVTRVWGV
jgi:hypothetical protein